MEKEMAEVFSIFKMEVITKGIGRTIKCMGKDFYIMIMGN